MHGKHKKYKKIILELVSVFFSLIILIPFLMLVINSFKSRVEANKSNLSLTGISLNQILKNYGDVIRISDLFTAYKNSTIITVSSVFIVIVLGSMAGFIIQRRKGKLTKGINLFIISGMAMPFCAPTTFFLIKSLRLSQSNLGIILVFTAIMFPMTVFMFTGFYNSIPVTLDEAAIIDGCSPTRLFFSIIFPLIKPITVTVLIVNFMSVWNDFAVSIFLLSRPSRFTVVLTTFSFYGQKASDWNLLFADIILISLPVIIIYFILQDQIVSGLTSGAVKG